MEWWNFSFWIIAVILCSLIIIIGHYSNMKMRYNGDFQAMERSRNLENGVLHNERRY